MTTYAILDDGDRALRPRCMSCQEMDVRREAWHLVTYQFYTLPLLRPKIGKETRRSDLYRRSVFPNPGPKSIGNFV